MSTFRRNALIVCAACMVLLLSAAPLRAGFDPNGEYWDGWVGASASGAPWLVSGGSYVSFSSDQTGSYLWNGETPTNPFAFSNYAITDLSQDSQGWMTIEFQEGAATPFQKTYALGEDLFAGVDRALNADGRLGIQMVVRKALSVYSDADMPGTYTCVRHVLTTSGPQMVSGTITLNGDGTFASAWHNFATSADTTDSGTWDLRSSNGQLDLDGTADSVSMNLGAGGMLGRFDLADYASGQVLYEMMTRVETGRQAYEVGGDWLIQSLLTEPNGAPRTVWGELSITGSDFSLLLDSSDGSLDVPLTGTLGMANDGKVTFFSGSTPIAQGYLSVEATALVLGTVGSSAFGGVAESGILLAVRPGEAVPTPEPTTLGLLIGGAGAMLLRRRTRKH